MHRTQFLLFVGLCLTVAGCSSAPEAGGGPPAYGLGAPAQLFEGEGDHKRSVTTDSAEAQAYFNQGLNWLFAFNHDEAVRSFTKAAEIDPDCAMAWWGVSYAQGPNYNDFYMTPARSAAAWEAMEKAKAALDDETAAERGLIDALSARYQNPPPDDRTQLEQSFSDAMAALHARYPADADIGAMYGESLMVKHPWKLYKSDGSPAREDTNEIVRVLESVMAANPYHPGANHLYIHAIEPSNDKERGIAAADNLAGRVPMSGHMQHMPSHIYVQVGMWHRSIEQNQLALVADAKYRALSPHQGIQHGYMAHNAHMLAFSAMMVGQEEEAMSAANLVWEAIPEEVLEAFAPFVDWSMCVRYDVLKRFGRWDELLAEPTPPAYLPLTTAVWRSHRAIAYAAKKDFDRAAEEQAKFREQVKALPVTGMFGYSTQFLLASDFFIDGEIALQQGNLESAASMLELAVAVEDTIGYGEPPLWLQPARHTLGAVYHLNGNYAEAERVFREDLDKWPGNGWSLFGLSRALEEQGRTDEAMVVRREYERVWNGAEEQLATSCKCIPEM